MGRNAKNTAAAADKAIVKLPSPEVNPAERLERAVVAERAGFAGEVPGTNPLADLARLSSRDVYLGRQPIYDERREVQAYELLYRRSAADATAQFTDPDRASAEVMLRAFVDIGLPRVSPEWPVYINYPECLLAQDPIIAPERCVIEVLETVPVNGATVARLKELKRKGYRIALDDFRYSQRMQPFVKLADIVKLDVRVLAPDEVRRHVGLLRGFGCEIVAEKVECEEEFTRLREDGIRLFQGYYLRKPETLGGRRIPSNRLSVLSAMAKCLESEVNPADLGAAIRRDATLTHGLLRLANSALYRRRTEIHEPGRAIVLLGMDCIFRWLSLLLLTSFDDCPRGYLESALQRARMCELVARRYPCSIQEAYLAGLLSTLDSIMGMPLAEILEPLPVKEDLKRACLTGEGPLGTVMRIVLAYEAGRIEDLRASGAPLREMQAAFWDAIDYADAMLTPVLGPARQR